MLPQDLICSKPASCKEDTWELLLIGLCICYYSGYRTQTRVTPCADDPGRKNGTPRAPRIQRSRIWCWFVKPKPHQARTFNPISCEEIGLLRLWCFRGLCSCIERSARMGGTVSGTSPRHQLHDMKKLNLQEIESHWVIEDTGNSIRKEHRFARCFLLFLSLPRLSPIPVLRHSTLLMCSRLEMITDCEYSTVNVFLSFVNWA